MSENTTYPYRVWPNWKIAVRIDKHEPVWDEESVEALVAAGGATGKLHATFEAALATLATYRATVEAHIADVVALRAFVRAYDRYQYGAATDAQMKAARAALGPLLGETKEG